MRIPISIERRDGQYVAAVLGTPTYVGRGTSRDEAVQTVYALLRAAIADGSLAFVDVGFLAHSNVPGTYSEAEIEATREMVEEIYRERDSERDREFAG
jgi:predicted RNase H-like HicB family nuclease